MISMLWAKVDVLLVYFMIWSIGAWMGYKFRAWAAKPKFWHKKTT